MWEIVAGIVLKIPDLFLRWADRTTVRLSVKRLEYDLIRNDPDSAVVLISPYPSRYYAEVGFSHRGKPTTIKNLALVIDQTLNLEAADFSPLKLDHGDYYQKVITFPVQENSAVNEGTFEIRAIDTFDKVYRRKGRFPIA